MKPGRPRTYQGKMVATIGVRAPEDLVNELFIYAQRRQTDVSEITRAYWLHLLERERRRKSLSENRQPDQKDALLTT